MKHTRSEARGGGWMPPSILVGPRCKGVASDEKITSDHMYARRAAHSLPFLFLDHQRNSFRRLYP